MYYMNMIMMNSNISNSLVGVVLCASVEGEESCSVILRQCVSVWERYRTEGDRWTQWKSPLIGSCPQAPVQLSESTEREGKVSFTYLIGRQVTYVSELLSLHRGDSVFDSRQTCPCVNDRQIKVHNDHLMARGLSAPALCFPTRGMFCPGVPWEKTPDETL